MHSVMPIGVIEKRGEDFLCPMLVKVIENNGPQFASKVFESFLQAIDILHKTSTPLWPQANAE